MLAILNSLNAHNFPIFQPILMILVSKFMVYEALSDKTYLSLGLLSPLKTLHFKVIISACKLCVINYFSFLSDTLHAIYHMHAFS